MGVWNPARGAHVWLRASAVPEFRPGESEPFRVWVTFEDISERKKASRSPPPARSAKYRALFENAAEGIIAIDPETRRFQFFNPALCAMFGGHARRVPKADVARHSHPKEALPNIVERIRATAAGERPNPAGIPCLRKDGSGGRIGVRGSVIEIEGRKIVFGLFTDVTERVRLEEQLRQAQKLDAIGQLAGGVAHDFNNLLTVISGNTELLLLETDAEDPKRGALADIRKASERAASLTRQLLAFSRKQVLEPKLVDVHLAIAGIEAMLRRLAGENIELATDYAAASSWVKVDPGQLEDVVVNLALNARDAMPRGGRITIRTWNLDTSESMDLEKTAGQKLRPKVAISISDTGSGIPPDLKGRLFEPFFTTKKFGKGSGLGLATVHGIVKQSGGEIIVESEPGKGSTFTVVLPSSPAPRPHSGSSPSLRALPRGTETVLVAEDEEAVRRIVTTALGSTGYRIIEARNGAEALEAARRHGEQIHLVVTDVVMPGMGGRELVERLAKDHPGVRVLYMSGYANDAVMPRRDRRARHGVSPEALFASRPHAQGARSAGRAGGEAGRLSRLPSRGHLRQGRRIACGRGEHREPEARRMSELELTTKARSPRRIGRPSASRLCAAAAIAIGALALAGWLFGVRVLMQVVPGLVAMAPNTAVGFVLAGLSLWLQAGGGMGRSLRVSHTAAAVVGLLGLVTAGEYLLGLNSGLDTFLFRDTERLTGSLPGRMAFVSALSFVAIAGALLTSRRQRTRWLADALGFVPGLLGLLFLAGYAYGVSGFHWIGSYKGMAIHTAVGFIFLTVGVLFAHPDRPVSSLILSESIGGVMVRRLLPFAIAIPIVLGWLEQWGRRAELYQDETGVALFVVATLVFIALVVGWQGAALERADRDRQRAARYARSLLEASLDPLVTISPEGKITDVNEATVRATGVRRGAMIGSRFSDYFTEPEKADEGYKLVLSKGEVRDYPLTLRDVSGRAIDVLYNATTYRDDAGAVQGVFAAARDVTARKEAERYARSLLEASLDPSSRSAPRGRSRTSTKPPSRSRACLARSWSGRTSPTTSPSPRRRARATGRSSPGASSPTTR